MYSQSSIPKLRLTICALVKIRSTTNNKATMVVDVPAAAMPDPTLPAAKRSSPSGGSIM